MSEDYKKTYDEYWKDLVEVDGELSLDLVQRELHDYTFLLSASNKVYDHVTGGRVSIPNTMPEVVMSEADEHYSVLYQDDTHPNDAKWISVEEIPAPDGEYLLIDANGFIYVGYRNGARYYRDDGLELEKITHWMPLPEPPEEMEKNDE